MSTSMREALDAAFKKQEEVGGPEEDAEESVGTPPEEEDKEPPVEEKPSGDEDKEAEERPKEDDEGHKGEESPKGKDNDKPDREAKPPKSGDKPGADKDAAPEGELKAPISWKPGVREHWGKLPKEVKEEIHRREKEIEKGLNQASGYKKVANEYFSVVKPFEHLIRAQNSTPARAITNLMTTAARLQTGTKIQRAQVVAEIIKSYDVDILSLDELLVGKTPKGGDPEMSRLLDERLKPINEFISSVNTTRRASAEKSEAEVASDLEKFSQDPKNEFFNDVIDDIADIMDLAANRGQRVTLKEAYDRACRMNPEISKIIDQRTAAEKGRLDADSLAKKRRAASSIKGSQDEDNSKKPDPTDLRGSVAAAWADLEESRG